MKRVFNLLAISCLIAFAGLTNSCEKENRKGSMTVRMEDDPVPFDNVFVEIRSVEVHYDNGNHNGWASLHTKSGIYDLLELQDGVTAVLVDNHEIPTGHINQMRLILGSDNMVKLNGISYPLALSSQDETGLKLNLDARVRRNRDVEILFDFDAEQSIIIEGNGTYRLKPVLHMVSVEYH